MASLELRNDRYRVVFMFGGKKYGYSLGTGDKDDAEALAGGVEKTLMRIEQLGLRVPEGTDIVTFVKNDGRVVEPASAVPETVTLARLRERYEQTHSQGTMEENSFATVQMHLRHFAETLGDRFAAQTLTLTDLQRHVDRRAKKKYRGRPLSPVTLRKEVASLRAVWNWGIEAGLLRGRFPNKGLRFPKGEEKPPFQTWKEIERQLARGGLSERERQELWDCLFLQLPEIDEFLAFVKEQSRHGFLHPMCSFAAHTGARRSEMLRVRIRDLDLEGKTVLIHEKKRVKGKRTTRRVPLSDFLAGVLKDWLEEHPGGQYLFCHNEEVPRSKKRSRKTGYKGEKSRTMQDGRIGKLRQQRLDLGPLTKDEAHDHFQRTIADGKWKVLRGWHVLRHSFISNCAAKGVDQRLIDSWVGHTTEEIRKRYRHLIPSVEREAIGSVFGKRE